MLWIILIILIVAGLITNNFTPLKVFGKIVAWVFGVIFVLAFISAIAAPMLFGILAKSENDYQREYWEKVKQTPLVQWACNNEGRQLYLGETPEYVYNCSTGKLIAEKFSEGYHCESSYTTVNHWKYCVNKKQTNSNYDYLRGK